MNNIMPYVKAWVRYISNGILKGIQEIAKDRMDIWELLFYSLLSTKYFVKNTENTNPGTKEDKERNDILDAYNNQFSQLTESLIDSNLKHELTNDQNANCEIEQYARS